jgi:membrane-associated protease RseP (regulator of RpoE activity)
MFVVGILVFILILCISVVVHEFGHMITAKAFGVKVSEFFAGFGKTIWSIKKGETVYGIKWLPLGGFCKMNGMYSPIRSKHASKKGPIFNMCEPAREETRIDNKLDGKNRSFYILSTPKKLVVTLAGPFMNLFLAIIFMVIVISGIGYNVPSTTLSSVEKCLTSTTCTNNNASPAYLAGLQAGDKIISVNNTKISTWEDLTNSFKGNQKKVLLDYERDGKVLSTTLTPQVINENGVSRNVIGVVASTVRSHPQISQLPSIIFTQIKETLKLYVQLPVKIINSAKQVFLNENRSANGLLSIVGVAKISGDVGEGASNGVSILDMLASWLMLGASLNLALWIFNLLPFVPLDGGQALGALWEGLRRNIERIKHKKKLLEGADLARTMPLAYGVWAFFIVLSLILIWGDLFNPIKM